MSEEVSRLRECADRLVAALALCLYDAHRSYGSSAKWGGAGGQTITPHCSITQGHPPGQEWAEGDMLSVPLREYLELYPCNLDKLTKDLAKELNARLAEGKNNG